MLKKDKERRLLQNNYSIQICTKNLRGWYSFTGLVGVTYIAGLNDSCGICFVVDRHYNKYSTCIRRVKADKTFYQNEVPHSSNTRFLTVKKYNLLVKRKLQ